MRLVTVDGRKIGCSTAAATLAIEDRCSHDDGPLAEGEFDAASRTVECPRHGSLFDLRTGYQSLPAYQPVETFPARIDDGEVVGGLTKPMTTPPETTQSTKVLTDEEAGLKDIGSDYPRSSASTTPRTTCTRRRRD